ncbi:MAG: Ig-like domain-containing protein [Muribaculaceae bacterium]|nr:Ig-like domain-containing protein [Muribaculaceae bacterium]
MKRYLLLLLLAVLITLCPPTAVCEQLIYGLSSTIYSPPAPQGQLYSVEWASKSTALQVTKTGDRSAKVTVISYFSGVAQVMCVYRWRWQIGGNVRTGSATTYFDFTCKPVDIRIDQTGPLTIVSGQGVPLSVTLTPRVSPSPKIHWSSSNSLIAEVHQNGYVYGRKPGSATISVSSDAGPNKATIVINVPNVPVEQAEIIPNSLDIVTGQSRTLELSLHPEYAKANKIEWRSNNSKIASVSYDGTVTGRSLGSTSVYCIIDGWLTTKSIPVKVSKPKLKIYVDKTSGLYEKGTIVNLSSDRSDAEIYYTLDGSIPDQHSKLYRSPISLENNVTLKAIAKKKDCLDSDILSVDYYVSSLKVSSTYPSDNSMVCWANITPSIIFDKNINIINRDGIHMHKDGSEIVKGQCITSGNILNFIPETNLNEGNYTFTLSEKAIKTVSGDYNFDYSFSFSIKGSKNISYIAAGNQFSIVVKEDRTLWAWGNNTSGQIGNGSTYYVLAPEKILDKVSFTTCSNGISAAITPGGTLNMWGCNNYGQIGNGSVKNSSKPIETMDGIYTVATSGDHTLAINYVGDLYTWGANSSGQLGLGKESLYQWKPNFIMSKVYKVSASPHHSLIIDFYGQLHSCGYGGYGELCQGNSQSSSSLRYRLNNVQKAVALKNASLILFYDGTLRSYGDNKYCQLGTELDISKSFDGVDIMTDVKDIDGNNTIGAAIKSDNSLWMWGNNFYGNVGNGTTAMQKTPVKILDNVKQVSVGDTHVLALTYDGKLYGWGDNLCREIGTSAIGDKVLTPTIVDHFTIPVTPTSLTLPDITLSEGRQGVILPNVRPLDAVYSKIEWSVKNPEIATVNDFGVVFGKCAGETSVHCKVYYDNENFIEASSRIRVNASPYFYLVGNMNGWDDTNHDYRLILSEIENGIETYSCKVNFAPGSCDFKIMSDKGFDEIFGPKEPKTLFHNFDFENESEENEQFEIVAGGNNFVLPTNYPGGDISIRLLITENGNMTAYFNWIKNSGLNDIKAESPCIPIYYTLDGIKIDNPGRGFYIKVENNKAYKIFIP